MLSFKLRHNKESPMKNNNEGKVLNFIMGMKQQLLSKNQEKIFLK